jgi:hypothetical protein
MNLQYLVDHLRHYCVICAVIGLSSRTPAQYLVGGDSVCPDHVKLRADCANLGLAISEARRDIEATRSNPYQVRTK